MTDITQDNTAGATATVEGGLVGLNVNADGIGSYTNNGILTDATIGSEGFPSYDPTNTSPDDYDITSGGGNANLYIHANVTGTGTLTLTNSAAAVFYGTVASTQTVVLDNASDPESILMLEETRAQLASGMFQATIDGFEGTAPQYLNNNLLANYTGDAIVLTFTGVNSLSYASGVLTVLDISGTKMGSLKIAGDYTTSDFAFVTDQKDGQTYIYATVNQGFTSRALTNTSSLIAAHQIATVATNSVDNGAGQPTTNVATIGFATKVPGSTGLNSVLIVDKNFEGAASPGSKTIKGFSGNGHVTDGQVTNLTAITDYAPAGYTGDVLDVSETDGFMVTSLSYSNGTLTLYSNVRNESDTSWNIAIAGNYTTADFSYSNLIDQSTLAMGSVVGRGALIYVDTTGAANNPAAVTESLANPNVTFPLYDGLNRDFASGGAGSYYLLQPTTTTLAGASTLDKGVALYTPFAGTTIDITAADGSAGGTFTDSGTIYLQANDMQVSPGFNSGNAWSTLYSGSLTINGGTLVLAPVVAGGRIQIASGSALTINSAIVDNGSIVTNDNNALSLAWNYGSPLTITNPADAPDLILNSGLTGTGTLLIGGLTEIGGAVAASSTVSFAAAAAALEINETKAQFAAGQFAGTITGFNDFAPSFLANVAQPTIDAFSSQALILPWTGVDHVTAGTNTATFYDASGNVLGTLHMNGITTAMTFNLTTSGGKTYIGLSAYNNLEAATPPPPPPPLSGPYVQTGETYTVGTNPALTAVINDTTGGSAIILGGASALNYTGGGTVVLNNLAGEGAATVTGGAAHTTLFAGGSDLTYSGANAILILGAGNSTVAGGASGAPAVVFGGTGSLDYTGGNGTLVLGSGSAVIHGGAAGTTEIVFAGTTSLTYLGQAENADVIGSVGHDTITAGSGGGYYLGGTGGFNTLTATGGNTVLAAGGNGDVLTGANSGGTYFLAASGNETLTGGAGAGVYFLGSGADNVHLGSSLSTVVGGTGSTTITGGGGSDNLFMGTGAADIFAAGVGGSMTVSGFRDGADHLTANGQGATVTVTGGSTLVSFSSGAQIHIIGVVDANLTNLFV